MNWKTKRSPIEQIRQLPVDQQLAIVHQIWDGLHDASQLVQEWHIKEAQRRAEELEAGKGRHDQSAAQTFLQSARVP